MVLPLLLLAQGLTGPQILAKAKARYDNAKTVTLTVERFVEEFKKVNTMKVWLRKDGHYRYEIEDGILITTPKRTWSVKPSAKGYKIYPGTNGVTPPFGVAEFNIDGEIKTPVIGSPKTVTWQGRSVIRVEADGTAATKETKLYFFFDPKTYDHFGTSANLGSVTQIQIYRSLKLNPPIPDSMFTFTPPKGYQLVKD